MKKVLAFDLDDTLNVAKTPITPDVAELLTKLLDYYEICPISGQKFEQFLIQIVDPMRKVGVKTSQLEHLHLFVAQGTQYYRYENRALESKKNTENAAPESSKTAENREAESTENPAKNRATDYRAENWHEVYNYPLTDAQLTRMCEVIEEAAKATGNWEVARLAEGDQIIENRISQVTFSALGQKAGSDEKYAWDPDHKKRDAIVAKCRELEPNFDYEVAGTTSVNVFLPGYDKRFGMAHLMEELHVQKDEILYFGDMTQKGGNDYPVVEMEIETITVKNYHETASILKQILEASTPPV